MRMLTKSKLKKIIQEELTRLLNEMEPDPAKEKFVKFDQGALGRAPYRTPAVGSEASLLPGSRPIGNGLYTGAVPSERNNVSPGTSQGIPRKGTDNGGKDTEWNRRSDIAPILDPTTAMDPETRSERRGVETGSVDEFEKHFKKVGDTGLFYADSGDPAYFMRDFIRGRSTWSKESQRNHTGRPGEWADVDQGYWTPQAIKSGRWLQKRWKKMTPAERTDTWRTMYRKYGRPDQSQWGGSGIPEPFRRSPHLRRYR
jgi:hypothetical protein